MPSAEIGKFLIIAGAAIAAIGLVFLFADRLPLGKLPGDITVGKGGFKVFIPISTCIAISVLLTLVFNFFIRK